MKSADTSHVARRQAILRLLSLSPIASQEDLRQKLAKEGFNHLELGNLSLFEGYTYEQTLTERLSTTKEANEASSAFLANRGN